MIILNLHVTSSAPRGRDSLEEFLECCLPQQGTHAGAGEEVLQMGDQQEP